jgi:hypothetical protein
VFVNRCRGQRRPIPACKEKAATGPTNGKTCQSLVQFLAEVYGSNGRIGFGELFNASKYGFADMNKRGSMVPTGVLAVIADSDCERFP